MNDTIHVVLSSDDNYARHLAVTIVSVLANRAEGDKLAFYILDGGIRQESRDRIERLVSTYDASIEFIPIDRSLLLGKSLKIKKTDHVSAAAYYRLFIPSFIKADRCIYMDCDIVCQGSLRALFQTNIGDKLIGAVRDVSEEELVEHLGVFQYFNSGVLLMELKAMRTSDIQKEFIRFIDEHHNRILMHDQDVINAVLEGCICDLDKTWNCQVCKTRSCKQKGFHALSKTAVVLHYIGRRKPWVKGCRAPGREQYWKYLAMTPWRISTVERMKFQIGDILARALMIFK